MGICPGGLGGPVFRGPAPAVGVRSDCLDETLACERVGWELCETGAGEPVWADTVGAPSRGLVDRLGKLCIAAPLALVDLGAGIGTRLVDADAASVAGLLDVKPRLSTGDTCNPLPAETVLGTGKGAGTGCLMSMFALALGAAVGPTPDAGRGPNPEFLTPWPTPPSCPGHKEAAEACSTSVRYRASCIDCSL